ncbi:MAG TPA: hypothetical protein VJ743_08025 [Albitalea sp.]|nr:hypothetical protein [Albitalea sp.]
MKLSLSTRAPRELRGAPSRRMQCSGGGFAIGLLGYLVLSAVFGSLPDDASLQGWWLAIGLVPATIGLCAGFALAGLVD